MQEGCFRLSRAVGMVTVLYPANTESEALDGDFQYTAIPLQYVLTPVLLHVFLAY